MFLELIFKRLQDQSLRNRLCRGEVWGARGAAAQALLRIPSRGCKLFPPAVSAVVPALRVFVYAISLFDS